MAANLQIKIEKVSTKAGIFCAKSYFYGFQPNNLLNEVLECAARLIFVSSGAK